MPFLYGKDTVSRVYMGNPPSPMDIWAKKIQVQEKATVNWDNVCGEQRSRMLKVTDGFTVSIDTFDSGSGNILRTYIRAQANDDAGNAPLGAGAGIVFRNAGGVMVVTFGGIIVLDPLDYVIESRGGANMATVKLNCQTLSEGPAVAI